MSTVLEPEPTKVGEPANATEPRPVRIDPNRELFRSWAVAAMAAIVAATHL